MARWSFRRVDLWIIYAFTADFEVSHTMTAWWIKYKVQLSQKKVFTAVEGNEETGQYDCIVQGNTSVQQGISASLCCLARNHSTDRVRLSARVIRDKDQYRDVSLLNLCSPPIRPATAPPCHNSKINHQSTRRNTTFVCEQVPFEVVRRLTG